ncbi:MAG: DUF2911 domain-containing protein [Acidobacteria bacterium]|nr:DUF2911 domain-containing protein [Acidobacteriota bacterium]
MSSARLFLAATLSAAVLSPAAASAQGVTLPASGGNQKASVSQNIGLVKVTVDYNSPDVTGPNGEDRRGKIWGQLVPWGMVNLGFGTAKESPWRAGANENTVITFSHDVQVQGQPLAAGAYGFHIIPAEDGDWTLIFSKNSTSWGSFFYDPAEDALRVATRPKEHTYTHWLTYEFTDRQDDRATLELQWEDLTIPFEIVVPNPVELYLANLRRELRSTPGFNWQGWDSAAQYCLQNDVNLEEALVWADTAISGPFVGQESFTTLQTKGQILEKLGRRGEADEVLTKAIHHPTANAFNVHQYGRQLLTEGRKERALEVFQANAARFPDTWPVDVGLARAYSALGQYEKALEHARLAYERAPNQLNKDALADSIKKLEKGEDIN